MSVFLVSLVLFLAMAGHSDAAYCFCSSGSDSVNQKNIDYACGAGADCSAILQNGACYNPNTVKDHCNYAVNSYYQRMNQVPGSCDFAGSATVSQTVPNAASGCVYQSSPSTGGSTTPSTNPTTGGTPNTTGTPSTNPTTGGTPNTIGTPSTNPTTGGTPNTGGTTTGTIPGSTMTPDFGVGSPTGTGFGSSTDNSASVTLLSQSPSFMLLSFYLTLFLMWPRI